MRRMLTETWAGKVVLSMLGGIGLWWVNLPVAATACFWLIVLDVLLGGIYHHKTEYKDFSSTRLLTGFFYKLCLVSGMGLASLVARPMVTELVNIDPLTYFLRVASLFELLGCVQNYVKAGGPGGEVIGAFSARVLAAFKASQDGLTQSDVSSKLAAQKQAGEDSRA